MKEFLDLCQGNVAKRQESRWEMLSNVSIVTHAFIRLLARAIYPRAILDSYESDALCVSILLSTDIWCKQFVFFSNNFSGNVFSERAQPSRKSPRSRLNAWRVVTAYCTRGSQTRHSKAFPEHKSQNSHCNEMCVHPVYLKNQLNKAGSTHKRITLFVPFLHGEARVLFVESAPL